MKSIGKTRKEQGAGEVGTDHVNLTTRKWNLDIFVFALIYENRSLYHLAYVHIAEAAEDATIRAGRVSHDKGNCGDQRAIPEYR